MDTAALSAGHASARHGAQQAHSGPKDQKDTNISSVEVMAAVL